MSLEGRSLKAEELIDFAWREARFPTGMQDAWRQIHYAAQAASEVGKSWGEFREDDSHSNFGWFDDGATAGFEGVATTTQPSIRARLDLSRLELNLVDTDGNRRDRLEFEGCTVHEALEWTGAKVEELVGPRLQPSRPAPDLPEHPLAEGDEFQAGDRTAFRAVSAWYTNADLLLRSVSRHMPEAEEPRCWPHHLDHATLSILSRDSGGRMSATIGMGLTPPDGIEGAGYWYVGPWTVEPGDSSRDWPDLPSGRWEHRPGTMPLAVLGLDEVSAVEGRDSQQERVAHFVATAVNSCLDRLG